MFIEAPDESTVDGDVAEWYQRQRDAWGYLPNYAPRSRPGPTSPRRGTRSTTRSEDHMDRRRFELATIAAARAYRSTYCMAAHCKFLRDDCDDESTMRAVAADPSGADLDATDRAVVDFATQVAQDASSITAADVQRAPRPGSRATPRSSTSCSRPPLGRSSPRCSTRSACRPTSSSARRSIPRSGAR